MEAKIRGWLREDGKVGIRNHIAVISSVACANHTVEEICKGTEAIPIIHNQGACGEFGQDVEQTVRTLINYGKHPNVAKALVVGLGCERVDANQLADKMTRSGKEVQSLLVQEEGAKKAVEKGKKILKRMGRSLPKKKREFPLSKLIIGVKCGASDFSSGLIANPGVGKASDYVVEQGGTVIFGERLEVVGAEQQIAERARKKVRTEFLKRVEKAKEDASKAGVDWAGSQPSRGNIEGGITTIEEKSLGAVKKAGSSELKGCLDYAELPEEGGLYFMDTPGYDVQCVTGLAAGGCHLILFTTGRGTYLGNPATPVVKICATRGTCEKLRDAIDVDLSSFLEEWDLGKAGERVIRETLAVARGKETKAERSRHREFSIERIGPTA